MTTSMRTFCRELDRGGKQNLSTIARLRGAEQAMRELLALTPELDAECMALPEEGYGRYLHHVCDDDGAVVVVMVWPPGYEGSIHDHRTWGVIGMHTGQLRITNYVRNDNGHVEGRARIEATATVTLDEGGIGTALPPHEDIHRISNPTDEVAISIHAYGRNADQCTAFDAEAGTCSMRDLAFTERGWRDRTAPTPRRRPANSNARVTTIMTPNPHWVYADESLDRARGLMDWFSFRHLPIIENKQLVGVLSDRDLLSATGGLPLEERRRARKDGQVDPPISTCMTRGPVCLEESATVMDAAMQFLDRGIGCLPILDKQGGLVGIVTEKDVLEMFLDDHDGIGLNPPPQDPPVHQIMTSQPLRVPTSTTIADAAKISRSNGVRHLPVTDEERLVGMVSDRDLRRAFGKGLSATTELGDIMQTNIVGIDPTTTVSRAIHKLVRGRFSALPILDPISGFVGLLTTADILEHCLAAYATSSR